MGCRDVIFTGYETQARDAGHNFHGIRGTKARDTRHKSTGYETQTRDTGHSFHGIRDPQFTGYETQKKLLKWLETLMQQALQDSEKNS